METNCQVQVEGCVCSQCSQTWQTLHSRLCMVTEADDKVNGNTNGCPLLSVKHSEATANCPHLPRGGVLTAPRTATNHHNHAQYLFSHQCRTFQHLIYTVMQIYTWHKLIAAFKLHVWTSIGHTTNKLQTFTKMCLSNSKQQCNTTNWACLTFNLLYESSDRQTDKPNSETQCIENV